MHFCAKGDLTTCGYIRRDWLYDATEPLECRMQSGKEASANYYAELNEELQELKQTVDSIVGEPWKIKVQPAVPKPELETRKCHIVLDCSFVVPVFLEFLVVVIGVFFAGF